LFHARADGAYDRGVSSSLFFLGLGKVLFGVLVAAVGIFFATRLFGRMTGFRHVDTELAKGNAACGVLMASAVLSLGILAQHAVVATFSAMDLAFHRAAFDPKMLLVFAIYGTAHVLTSFGVGLAVLRLGTFLFDRLTKGVDETAEIQKGNVAPALVLGAVVVVLALMTAPGVQMALEGLLPLPPLARDELLAPA
jgi:uncharacterized membrane protein YjfL (UPF0719 family)